MNAHFPQIERKSQLFSYILVALAVFAVLRLVLSFSQNTDLHLSIPSTSIQVAHAENTNLPIAIPAPMPPADPNQTVATLTPAAIPQSIPQAIPAPSPSVP